MKFGWNLLGIYCIFVKELENEPNFLITFQSFGYVAKHKFRHSFSKVKQRKGWIFVGNKAYMSTTPNLTQFVFGSWKIDSLEVES